MEMDHAAITGTTVGHGGHRGEVWNPYTSPGNRLSRKISRKQRGVAVVWCGKTNTEITAYNTMDALRNFGSWHELVWSFGNVYRMY